MQKSPPEALGVPGFLPLETLASGLLANPGVEAEPGGSFVAVGRLENFVRRLNLRNLETEPANLVAAAEKFKC